MKIKKLNEFIAESKKSTHDYGCMMIFVKLDGINKIHSKIEAKIIKASASNYYETWYLIPEFMIGNPRYSLKECIDCINERLIKDGFKTQLFNPNLLYIKWGE
jgi:hypothetical protein